MVKPTPEQLFLFSLLKGDVSCIPEDVDVSLFFRLLQRHKLFPLAEKLLPHLDRQAEENLRIQLRQWAARSLFMFNELKLVLDQLRRSGITAVSLKGPVLSLQLYGNTHQRQYSDLDILVHPSGLLNAVKVLKNAGYDIEDRKFTFASLEEGNRHFRYNNDLVLHHAEKRIRVELHIGLQVEQLLSEEDHADFIRNTVEVETGGVKTCVLSPEHNFLYLCYHGAKHMYFRLSWLRDVASSLDTIEMDHDRILKLAYRYRLTKALFLSLELVREYFSTQLPEVYSGHLKKEHRLFTWSREIILGPGELVYEGYSRHKRKKIQEQGIDKVTFRIFLLQVAFLVLLRSGSNRKIRFLFYQIRKRLLK